MLIAQLSDVHVGGARYSRELLETAIGEINAAEPDIVVVAGDLTDDGYPDQYPLAKQELDAIACEHVILVPGNHDARNVGYVLFEDTFGARDRRVRLECAGLDVALVAVDSSKPDLDEGEIGREHYGWIEEGFAGDADLRIFVCHHHLMPVPGTGPRAQPGARRRRRDLAPAAAARRPRAVGPPPRPVRVARGRDVHRPLGHGLDAAHARVPASGVQPDQGRERPNRSRAEDPGRRAASLGDYPRDWPEELSARHYDPFVRAQRGESLAND